MCDGGGGSGGDGDMGDVAAAAAAAAAGMGASAGMGAGAGQAASGQSGVAGMGGMDPGVAAAIADDIAMSVAQGNVPGITDMSGTANNNPNIGPAHAQAVNAAFSQDKAAQDITGLTPSMPMGLFGLVGRTMLNPMTNRNAIGFGFNPGNLAGTIGSAVTGVPGLGTIGSLASPTFGFATPDPAGTGFGSGGSVGPAGAEAGDSGAGTSQAAAGGGNNGGNSKGGTAADSEPAAGQAYVLRMPEYARGILDAAPLVTGPNLLDYLANYDAYNNAFRIPGGRVYPIG